MTLWTKDRGRFTRNVDFLSFGAEDEETLKAAIAEILAIDADDGLIFDDANLTAAPIRDDQVYGGMRLKTTAFLEKTQIPITIDVGFGDALGKLDYGSLLDFPSAAVRAYSPETVIAETFQAIVTLGIINGRMKDYYNLWALPKAVDLNMDELQASIEKTFERRQTEVPKERPPGLSEAFASDATKSAQWRAYSEATEIEDMSLADVVDDIWAMLEPICARVGRATLIRTARQVGWRQRLLDFKDVFFPFFACCALSHPLFSLSGPERIGFSFGNVLKRAWGFVKLFTSVDVKVCSRIVCTIAFVAIAP